MRTALIVALSVGWITSASFAQTGPSTPRLPGSDKGNPSPGKTAEEQLGSSSGDATDTLAECLETWDLATHMSRKEWARACRRVADRLKRPAIR